MRYLLLYIFILLISPVFSQSAKEKGLETINLESAKAYVGFLASDALEGREAGERGAIIAAEYIKSQLTDMKIKPLYGDNYFQPFEGLVRKRGETERQKANMHNILGFIEGRNSDEYVIIGAHYDHLGIDENLEGDKIYNGADDNASGVSAVLQIAKAFMISGQQPERTIIFAFWDGEESGLLGSDYFVNAFFSHSKIKAYLNFDMIGRNNDESKPNHVVYFYTASNPLFGDWLKEDIKRYNLILEPDYRAWDNPVGGSDNSSFAKKGIPIIWYHTDGHADYHQPGDHAEKINWDKLINITKAAYLNLWNLANVETY